ncbi:MAG: ATP F0F1 synthase subunit B [Hyphomicrobiales bacterium]|nr:MAG: ATP F0F1 synthase subunit B [Hyphomicrobiales bacterium]
MDATAWATVGLFVFLGILVYNKVPGLIADMLDKRAADISSELDEARRLREEAQALLADYQRKQREAEKEAEGIIDQAKREANMMALEAKASLEEFVVRRTKLAEQKIASAEAAAAGEVRAAATDLAIAATEAVLATRVQDKTAEDLITASIKEVGLKLN